MQQRANPYKGTYSPSRTGLSRQDLVKGLKGIKVNAPNKKLSTQQYKSGLRKIQGGEGG